MRAAGLASHNPSACCDFSICRPFAALALLQAREQELRQEPRKGPGRPPKFVSPGGAAARKRRRGSVYDEEEEGEGEEEMEDAVENAGGSLLCCCFSVCLRLRCGCPHIGLHMGVEAPGLRQWCAVHRRLHSVSCCGHAFTVNCRLLLPALTCR